MGCQLFLWFFVGTFREVKASFALQRYSKSRMTVRWCGGKVALKLERRGIAYRLSLQDCYDINADLPGAL
jgi:hypothetical protein